LAKTKKPTKEEMPIKDRTIFWTDLSYVKPELKNEIWAAQVIYFAKKNARRFADPVRAIKNRRLGSLEIDESKLKELFDPKTPGDGGGQASYTSASFKAFPGYIHLINTIRAEMQRTSKQIEANFTDKYSKTRKMRDSYKALYSRKIRSIINENQRMIGEPEITESQDPYKWVENLSKSEDSKEQGSDIVSKFADLIKNKIENNEDLLLYNEMVYKGDYEQAIEKGIKFYFFGQNRWEDRWADEFADNMIYLNQACGEYYTDRITGRPVIEGFIPELLWVSPFRRKDGADIQYYFIEYLISFKDFVSTIAYGLPEEKLKQVFEYNKTQGSSHGIDWLEQLNRPNRTRDDAMIRIGKCGVLSQDYDIFLDAVKADTAIYEPYNTSWDKREKNEYSKAAIDEKHYNVWRTFYYIPPASATEGSNTNADYTWQANFIFDLKKNLDQSRTGESGRYCTSPLVIYDNHSQATVADIIESYMGNINFLWNDYQNCIVNDVEAAILSDDFMGGLLSAVDEANAVDTGLKDQPSGGNEVAAAQEQWKMIKQAGKGFIKMTDKQGKPIIDPSKLIVVFKNGLLEKADRVLVQLLKNYEQLVIALGNEPEANKPRVPVAGIEEAAKSSANAKWFVQKGYEEIIKQYGERLVRYIITIGQEAKLYGAPQRYDDFKDIIGVSAGLLIEGLEDIPPESIGLNINYVDNSAKKDFMLNFAMQYVSQGKLDEEILYLIQGSDNWKEMWVMVRMGITKKKKEAAAQQQLEHEQIMEQKQMDLKIAMAGIQAKGAAKDKNIQTQAQGKMATDKALNEEKAKTMATQKSQLLNNKNQENQKKAELERQNKTYDALAPA
jgi:hypothetical protein